MKKNVKNIQMKMMMSVALLFLGGMSVYASADHVIINQVLYDPIGSETGGEAVELYNPTSSFVNISGWVIKTGSSATDAVLGNNVILQPTQHYLIADAGWDAAKDNVSWPVADHEEPITLANTNSGVALLNGTKVIDAVGWGDPAFLLPDLFEGSPAPQVSAGQALRRLLFSDSNNNSADFVALIPDFHNSAGANETPGNDSKPVSNVSLVVIVTNSQPQIDQILVAPDEDLLASGVQILPFPGQNATVNVTAVVTDLNQHTTIASVKGLLQPFGRVFYLNKTGFINATTALFQGTSYLQFFEASQNYSIVLDATDDTNASVAAAAPFQYSSVTAIELETAALNFGFLSAGAATFLLGDALFGTVSQPTVRNIGNSKIDLGIKGSALASGGASIPVSSIKYTFDASFSSNVSGTLSTSMSMKPAGMAPGAASYVPLSLELTVPAGTKSGLFNGQLMLAAASP
ncbi:lamin tail domain-containing protein [Candidatus Woesearchaeota archaeon]|nr:lamin tail domain-containing protein [Candidatus Woesearchaeota archaeon]